MANHGATTVGPTLLSRTSAWRALEHGARILLTARLLGRVNGLTPAQVDTLLEARQRASPAERIRLRPKSPAATGSME